MALYLVQHGKSLPKDQDPNQGLSEEGMSETELIAKTAAEKGVVVAQIRHSVKTRARQTAKIFSQTLNPAKGIQEIAGIKPMDDVAAAAADLSPAENIMLVGHLPFMERMAAFLVTGSIAPPIFKFQNSGIVCLDKKADSQTWIMLWAIMPQIG